jgi:hypothetical protein
MAVRQVSTGSTVRLKLSQNHENFKKILEKKLKDKKSRVFSYIAQKYVKLLGPVYITWISPENSAFAWL